ncbi:alpha/beta fold hydrolase BchO [Albimonas pacifica]|uniref:Magnesium chelatase accessory protein n=1 Tax=Albimonas pacifica TaxID=1114924 RepID=A0A1I3CPF2_9RHOB|nr:alpha/beta fold hydrolase BchO [Albimonas pacifica]SFH76357.1 magnesium chelatase accessory protein [Albimonas pacifica]
MRWEREGADWPHREASRFVRTPGHRWHVQRLGEGPGLLLLHGTGASTHSWRDLAPLLARDHAVLSLDLPGHGFTESSSPARCALPAMAQDLETLLATLDFEPEAVIGHSAGAAAALRMALDRPRPVVGLNAALRAFHGPLSGVAMAAARAVSLTPLVPVAFSRLAAAPGLARALLGATGSRLDARGEALYRRLLSDAGHAAGALAMMARWDLDPLIARLGEIRSPVALLAGGRDGMVPPEVSREAAARMGAAYELIPDLGHLMHEEAPERLDAAIRRHLAAFRAQTPAAVTPPG